MEVEQQGIQEVHQHSGMVAEATVVVQATYDPTTMQVSYPHHPGTRPQSRYRGGRLPRGVVPSAPGSPAARARAPRRRLPPRRARVALRLSLAAWQANRLSAPARPTQALVSCGGCGRMRSSCGHTLLLGGLWPRRRSLSLCSECISVAGCFFGISNCSCTISPLAAAPNLLGVLLQRHASSLHSSCGVVAG